MRAKDIIGNPLFSSEEYLSQSQISGVFSRLASKKRLQGKDDENLLDIDGIEGVSSSAQLSWKNLHLWLHKRLDSYTPSVLTPTTCVICTQTVVLTNYWLIR